jgi:hypothetical protein
MPTAAPARHLRLVPLLAALLLTSSVRAAEAPDPAGVAFFEKKIRPVLAEHCLSCHSDEAQRNRKLRGGLRLDSREAMLKGGDSGPALVPGKPEASLLLKALRHQEEVKPMPPAKKLSDAVVADFEHWIKIGAPDPRTGTSAGPRVIDLDAGRRSWAFGPLLRTSPPTVKHTDQVRNPVDRFLLAKLEEKGLAFNPAVGREKLIRRVTFDLTGLPPTPEELASFCKDDSPDAYEKLVDRLLASERYGERWGRHWLDLVRYAESGGYEFDKDRPAAYHYRDFVIRALNEDMPYDEFVRLQIAGDHLHPGDVRATAATGFLVAGPYPGQTTAKTAEPIRYDHLDDMLSTFGSAFLGLSLGCARCHDHKFDPIPQRDYYALLACLARTDSADLKIDPDRETTKRLKEAYDRVHAPLVEVRDRFEQEHPERRRRWFRKLDAEAARIYRAVDEHAKTEPKPKLVTLFAATSGRGGNVHFLIRGETARKNGVAQPGFVQVLTTGAEAEQRWLPAGPKAAPVEPRVALARWVTDAEHGGGRLLARVIVNRLWQHHFGKGLVRTPNDFGVQGEPPTHPELLDYLADELIRNGWSLKRLHRIMVTSAAYRQAGDVNETALKTDPQNRLLWRVQPRRLEAEAVRDSLLAVSGTLDSTMYGPGTLDENSGRRSVYLTVKRSRLTPLLQTFDAPEPVQSVGERQATTVAPQSLVFMNSPFVRQRAEKLAQRIRPKDAAELPRAVEDAYRLTLSRPPTDAERDRLVRFVRARVAAAPGPKALDNALADACHVLLCLNEFVYVD